MDQEDIEKKSKRKKHDRSRSRSERKKRKHSRSRSQRKRKHSRSRSQRKKDKKKKQKKDDQRRQRRKSREKRSSSRVKSPQRAKQSFSQKKQERHKIKSIERKQQKREQKRQSRHDSRSRHDRKQDKHYDRRQDKYDKYNDRRQDKYGDRREDKYSDRKVDKRDDRREDRRDSRRYNWRDDRRDDRRDIKRDDSRRDDNRRDDNRRDDHRRAPNRFDNNRFRFDSPPKSDQSDMSEDPEKMQKLNRMKAQKQLVTSKADRKLYLGNLPPNITSQQLIDMLNAALKKMQINTETEGDSIISAWISPDGVGHYAFVEFRTAQQATNGLTLNGASLFGYQLKLGRPKQYIEYNKQLLSEYGTDSSIDTIIKKVAAMGGDIKHQVKERIICPPSPVVILKHIVTVEELAIDEEYQQIYDDVMEMAKRFGDVVKLVIPRPHQVIDLQEVQKRVKGLGYIFIQYKTVEKAIFARKQFIQKQFSGRSVACSYFDKERFYAKQYDINEKVVIDF